MSDSGLSLLISYRTVKNILSAGTDRLPLEEETSTPATPPHENIRGAGYYATQEEIPCCRPPG